MQPKQRMCQRSNEADVNINESECHRRLCGPHEREGDVIKMFMICWREDRIDGCFCDGCVEGLSKGERVQEGNARPCFFQESRAHAEVEDVEVASAGAKRRTSSGL